ncbi:GntR family transcriptional regulator [Streptomyces sp. NBC_01803]|uniref:GntR family transcriptional regulator n=1 Tax=Streptomyces sp. NBC_01803 TaxID=2975946 RepID=UPI002DD80E14|nr:GntR family transcriptional regulator [Streptomyces sp. NBC_01803]WSA45318.1 GntR family transcriptional regulator [Streptomyces sp. NBC_01803]
MTDRAAKFRVIAEDLRKEIQNGVITPGEKLPSEHQLADRFETTRATVRKAVALLRSEGLVVSRQGAGVIVRPRPQVRMLGAGANYRARRATGVSNFNAEAAAQGQRAVQHIREVTEEPATPEIADLLEVEAGTALVVRRRLFTVDDEPMQLVDGYYQRELVAGTPIAAPRRIRGGVHAVLEDPSGSIRRRVARFVEDLDIRMPSPEERDALAVPPGVPIARVLRTAYDTDGKPIEVLDSLIPCDRHIFRYVIELPSADGQS